MLSFRFECDCIVWRLFVIWKTVKTTQVMFTTASESTTTAGLYLTNVCCSHCRRHCYDQVCINRSYQDNSKSIMPGSATSFCKNTRNKMTDVLTKHFWNVPKIIQINRGVLSMSAMIQSGLGFSCWVIVYIQSVVSPLLSKRIQMTETPVRPVLLRCCGFRSPQSWRGCSLRDGACRFPCAFRGETKPPMWLC